MTDAVNTNPQLEIGASDVPIIMGLSHRVSPMQLWMRKLGIEPFPEETEAMIWGRVLERPVAQEWARRKGVRLFYPRHRFYHKKLKYFRAQIDSINRQEKQIVEIKTGRFSSIDDHTLGMYVMQVYAQLIVYRRARSAKIVYFSLTDRSLTEYDVAYPDPETEKMILSAVETFHSYLLSDQPPPPILGSEDQIADYWRFIRRLRGTEPEENGRVLRSPAVEELIYELSLAADAKKEAEQRYEIAKARLIAEMVSQGVSKAEGSLGKVEYKVSPVRTVRYKEALTILAERHPDIADEIRAVEDVCTQQSMREYFRFYPSKTQTFEEGGVNE